MAKPGSIDSVLLSLCFELVGECAILGKIVGVILLLCQVSLLEKNILVGYLILFYLVGKSTE